MYQTNRKSFKEHADSTMNKLGLKLETRGNQCNWVLMDEVMKVILTILDAWPGRLLAA